MAPALGLQHGGVVHHQHQLAGVRRRDDDELPDADGRARVPQLHLGRGRHRAGDRVHPRHRAPARQADDRQLLGGPDAWLCSGCCCPSASSARWCSCRRAWSRTSSRTTSCRRSTAAAPQTMPGPGRVSGIIKNWAPTAAASSTPTALTRSRTRRRSRTSSRCSRSSRSPAGLTYTLGDMTGSAGTAGRCSRRWRPLPGRRHDRVLGRGARQPAARGRRSAVFG